MSVCHGNKLRRMTKEGRNRRISDGKNFKVVFNLAGWRFVSPKRASSPLGQVKSSQVKSKGIVTIHLHLTTNTKHTIKVKNRGPGLSIAAKRASVGACEGPFDAPLLLSRPPRTPKPDKSAEYVQRQYSTSALRWISNNVFIIERIHQLQADLRQLVSQ